MAEPELERPTPRIAFHGLLMMIFCMPQQELERPTIAFHGLLLAPFCLSTARAIIDQERERAQQPE